MSETYDIVVAGGGHNSLTASAYLAAAGLKVLVLERNPWMGGGVVTGEFAAPGFRHDLHSNAHMLIQANPLIRNDELGLQARFGLKYIRPEISVATVFDDGSSLLTYHDLDKTCESIARLSPRDAESYRSHVESSRKLLPMFVSGLFAPPAPFGAFMSILEQSREGRALIGVMHKSAYDLIEEIFENEKLKIHFMKYSSEAMAGPEEKGTGLIFSMLVGFVHSYHGGFPEGGSAGLTDALIRCIAHHGGETRTDTHVSKVIVEGGRAVGVATDSGEEFRARRAVIGCFHPQLLADYVAGLDPDLVADARKTHPGPYSAIQINYALSRTPVYPALEGLTSPTMVECLPSDINVFRQEFDALRYGRMPDHESMVCILASNHDAGRVPQPGNATLNIYSFAPYRLADGGPEAWDAIKDRVADRLFAAYGKYATNVGPETVVGRYVTSPLDSVRHNISFQQGDISGIGRYLYQFLGRRPTPELSRFAVPGVEGLYLCGPFMHPGGGVIGGGRAVAVKIFDDLGIELDNVIGDSR